MTYAWSVTLVGGLGAVLAAVLLAASKRDTGSGRARRLPGAVWVSVAAAPVALLSGDVIVVVVSWLAAAVFVSAHRPGDIRRAAGVLGDLVAATGLALVAADTATAELAWDTGAVLPVWALTLVALGIALRAGACGMREPGLLVVACTIGARASLGGTAEGEASVAAVLALVAAAVAWAEGPLPALPVLAAGWWHAAPEVAADPPGLVFVAAIVAVAGTAFAGAPSTGSLWRWRTFAEAGAAPPGGATAGGLALLAVLPGVVLILRSGVADAATTIAAAGALGVVGAAGAAAGARRLRPEAYSPRMVPALAAGAVLAAAVLTPAAYGDALDLGPGSEFVVAFGLTRGAMAGAAGFAATATLALLAVSRLAQVRAREPQRDSPEPV